MINDCVLFFGQLTKKLKGRVNVDLKPSGTFNKNVCILNVALSILLKLPKICDSYFRKNS